jgi:hypothetical protein
VSAILVILGIFAFSLCTPFQDGWYWFGTYEDETEVHRKYGTRLALLGVALFLAAFAIMQFVVDAE